MTGDHQLAVLMGVIMLAVFGVAIIAAWFAESRLAKLLFVAGPALFGVSLFLSGISNPPDAVQITVGTVCVIAASFPFLRGVFHA